MHKIIVQHLSHKIIYFLNKALNFLMKIENEVILQGKYFGTLYFRPFLKHYLFTLKKVAVKLRGVECRPLLSLNYHFSWL